MRIGSVEVKVEAEPGHVSIALRSFGMTLGAELVPPEVARELARQLLAAADVVQTWPAYGKV